MNFTVEDNVELNERMIGYNNDPRGNWFKWNRSILNWEWRSSVNHYSIFGFCLENANYKKSKWRGIDLNEGQLITGRKQISLKTGVSEQGVRTVLRDLKSTGEITFCATNRFTIITICNWELYQQGKQGDQPAEQPAIQPTINHQSTTSKKLRKKEYKNKKVFDFEALYKLYPKRETGDDMGKGSGITKCIAQIKTQESYDKLKTAITNYKKIRDIKNKPSFTKMFSTFMSSNVWPDLIDIELPETREEIIKRELKDLAEFVGEDFLCS